MSLLPKQAKKFIGEFCTKITVYKGNYKVHFDIPNENKKTIVRLSNLIESIETGKTSAKGYVEVNTDPSSVFGKEAIDIMVPTEKKASPKKKSVSKVVAEPKVVDKVEVAPKTRKEEKKIEVKKEGESKAKVEKPKLSPPVRRKESEAPKKKEKKEDKKEEKKEAKKEEKAKPKKKKKKRGFFSFRSKKDD